MAYPLFSAVSLLYPHLWKNHRLLFLMMILHTTTQAQAVDMMYEPAHFVHGYRTHAHSTAIILYYLVLLHKDICYRR